MTATSQRIEFEGSHDAALAARLDVPAGTIRAYAIFAHCFTCSKDLNATRRIAGELARLGIAVLRFDFTGLGSSEGEFASTNFSSNVDDLKRAADYLRDHHRAPSLLIGHSLGGAAVLAVAADIPEVDAVVTIGAPADANHVVKNFGADLQRIREEGEAQVSLAGRKFAIRRQFLQDLEKSRVTERVRHMRKALLILHSPTDQTVGIENAADIFVAARHPKSFVSLDGADHLLTGERDAVFAARMISSWAERYLDEDAVDESADAPEHVTIAETGNGKFQNTVHAGRHRLTADEPVSVGGLDSGPSPYDLLAAALGTCTSMTLRMYADFKKLDIGMVTVEVEHAKVHAADCAECTDDERAAGGKIDRFERRIAVSGAIDDEVRDKLVAIADRCPVHRTLEHGARIVTRYG
ncbi:MAG: bifunctional alpha/beta hydrolase/OsmC family protein [Pseudomonadota bacterium]|nr:bifunctional alpha/beta hydrolase/OsmC family protein [Pseudomonadota bacterium]